MLRGNILSLSTFLLYQEGLTKTLEEVVITKYLDQICHGRVEQEIDWLS